MAYIRKGTTKLVKGSLRYQFNYYKRQLVRRVASEISFEIARVGMTTETPLPKFKRLDYDDIYTKGLTRKVGNKTVRFFGEEAIKIQIQSFRRRASKSSFNRDFLNNYIKSLEYIGMPKEYITDIRRRLESLSGDKLKYLLNEGILRDIQFIYAKVVSFDELYQEIISAIRSGVNSEELRTIQAEAKLLKPNYEKIVAIKLGGRK